MRLMVVHPGASWATHDVHVGVVEGLKANGVEVVEWRLDGRMAMAHNWLHYLWRQQKKVRAKDEVWAKPNQADAIHHATIGLVERALEARITDVLIITAMFIPLARIELMRRAGLRVWLLCTESPYQMDSELIAAAACHGVWTNERSSVSQFASVQPNAAYLRHAWREGVHDILPTDDATDCDVFFCGSMFAERIAWLSAVDWTGINLHLYCRPQDLPVRSVLRKYLRGGVTPNKIMITLAKRSKIALNLFRAATVTAESLNPRCYELSAAGVCVVSDHRAEYAAKFPDAPIVTTPAEASAMLHSLLADQPRRATIAAAMRAAVAQDVWRVRAQELLGQLTAWQQTLSSQGV